MFEQQISQETQLSGWKATLVNWIDRNYGTDEQLAQLGLQKRAWYSFNFVELSLITVFGYLTLHYFIGVI